MTKEIDSKAYFYQVGDSDDTIAVTPSNVTDIRAAGYGRDSIIAGLRILLSDTYGYNEGTYIIRPPYYTDDEMSVEVQFVGEGIVMAKLKGLLK